MGWVRLAIGYDEGTIVIKLGHEVPVSSMDTNTGKEATASHSHLRWIAFSRVDLTEYRESQ